MGLVGFNQAQLKSKIAPCGKVRMEVDFIKGCCSKMTLSTREAEAIMKVHEHMGADVDLVA